jgi:hypothetical protein
MPEPSDQKPGTKTDTGEYSATKAPETRNHAEERETISDPRLMPGGAHGATSEIGMSAMDRADVPSASPLTSPEPD